MDTQLTIATLAELASTLQKRVNFLIHEIGDTEDVGEELFRARTYLGLAVRSLNNANEGSRYVPATFISDGE